jgi:dihydroneopterin aldolase
VGTNPRERVTRQGVVINLTLECSLLKAGMTDRLADTVDYVGLRDRVLAYVESSQHFLIETLAARIARLCLAEDRRITAVTVAVDKPGALTGARSVAVEIRRARGGSGVAARGQKAASRRR